MRISDQQIGITMISEKIRLATMEGNVQMLCRPRSDSIKLSSHLFFAGTITIMFLGASGCQPQRNNGSFLVKLPLLGYDLEQKLAHPWKSKTGETLMLEKDGTCRLVGQNGKTLDECWGYWSAEKDEIIYFGRTLYPNEQPEIQRIKFVLDPSMSNLTLRRGLFHEDLRFFHRDL